MAGAFTIESYLTTADGGKLVIDIGLGDQFYLDAHSPNQQTNQLWEAVQDPASGYFFIKSVFKDSTGQHLFIDIKGVTKATANKMGSDTSLVAHSQDKNWYDNQLWAIALDPGVPPNTNITPAPQPQTDPIFIRSKLSDSTGRPYVIDVRGWTFEKVYLGDGSAKLDAHPQKTSDWPNQLWRIVPQHLSDWPNAPRITKFTPDYDVSDRANSTMTVTGTGFLPGATLFFFSQLTLSESTNYYGPLLGVTDFAGNFSQSASYEDWGLGFSQGGTGISNQDGQFAVGVGYNSSSVSPEPQVATASAQWNGDKFSNFSAQP